MFKEGDQVIVIRDKFYAMPADYRITAIGTVVMYNNSDVQVKFDGIKKIFNYYKGEVELAVKTEEVIKLEKEIESFNF